MNGNNHDEAENLERARRLRVARAWAGVDQATVAKRLGISVITVKRMERGKTPVSTQALHDVAHLCEVPLDFMLGGFNPADDLRQLSQEVREGFKELSSLVINATSAQAIGDAIADRLSQAARRRKGEAAG